jgi:hypothetical protein
MKLTTQNYEKSVSEHFSAAIAYCLIIICYYA